MNQVAARQLAQVIEREPGWHAEVQRRRLSGEWFVRAWETAAAGDEWHFTFDLASEWYTVQQAARLLAELQVHGSGRG